MTDFRINAGVIRGQPVRFTCDGVDIDAFEGETVAAALWAAGVREAIEATTSPDGPPWRTMFCLMGVCQQCAVWVDGRRIEGCRVAVAPGLVVRTSS
ncbi:MAG: (2Fe-2S)-binding protein [Betaproteobacteria bacterium]